MDDRSPPRARPGNPGGCVADATPRPLPVRRSLAFAGLAVGLFGRTGSVQADAVELAALDEPGTTLLLRHALTEPGIGDPPGFRLGDCASQRNLSDEGRAQARRGGERLRARAVRIDAVLSSRWCRCLETARLAFGEAAPWPALDSFFGDPGSGPARTRALAERVARHSGPGLLVMVTHQVNITAATGQVPAMGEALAVRPGPGDALRITGRVRFS